jgi:glycosyltransferase involved in cell wall biosynthesis
MKVLHVEAGRHLYGGARQVLYLLEGLARHGCTSLLACPPGSAIAAEARALGVEVRETAIGGDLDLALVARLYGLLRRERPDILHLHSRRGADVLGAIAARLAGVPCVLSRRVDNPEPVRWARLKYRLYDHVIAISEGIRQVLLAEGVPPGRLSCVRSAVAPGGHACDRAAFERDFDLPPGARALGVVAQLIPRKGHRYLFEALPGLLRRYPDLYVLCFGRGPLQAELAAAVAAPRYDGRVRLAGFRADLPRLLPCLYGVVHPAEREGLGVALLQAAAAGVPVVASAAGGIPEVVHDGVNGWLVPPGDVGALDRAIARLLDDPAAAAAMGEAGRRLAREQFSTETMVEGNWRVYRAVLEARARAAPI